LPVKTTPKAHPSSAYAKIVPTMPLHFDLTLSLERCPQDELPRYLHSLIFSLWRLHDPVGADQHHKNNASPFSLSFGSLEGNRLDLRLSLLEEHLLEVFQAMLSSEDPFGDGEKLAGSIQQMRWGGERYSSLLERCLAGDAPRVLELDFKSCTVIASTKAKTFKPNPEGLFKGILKRVLTFTDLRYPPQMYAYLAESVHLGHSTLERTRVSIEQDQWLEGFKGKVHYRLDHNTLEGRWVGFLAVLSEYSGAGKRVGFGCGTVRSRVLDAWW
jgi:hypothetical protein